MSSLKQHPILLELHSLLGFWPPLVVDMTAAFARPVVDFVELDSILKIYWKTEYRDIMSQDDFVLHKFGARALELLNKTL